MKKILAISLIILSVFVSYNLSADIPQPPSIEIKDGSPLTATPVYNSIFNLYDVLNGKIDDLNIKNSGISATKLAGNIPTSKLVKPFDINSIIADGNITFAKLNSDIFGGDASVIYNNVGNYIDLRYNSTFFEKDGSNQLDLKDGGITGAKLNTAIADNGLSQTVAGNLQVNVDDSTITLRADKLQLKSLNWNDKTGTGADYSNITQIIITNPPATLP